MDKIFRKILTIAAIMLCTITCVSANSEYTISDDMITKYNGNADVVIVPAVIDGVEIAGIDPGAFENKNMHTVIIEEGIEVIRPKAFVGCKNLQYVKAPESMLLINEYAFFECNLGIEIDACENTHIMGEGAVLFSETDGELTGGTTTGGTTTGGTTTGGTTTGGTTTGGTTTDVPEIVEFLYSGNTITGYVGVDTDITIPEIIDGVIITTIGESAFLGNTQMTSVTIPDTVTTIGNYAFKGCTALAQVKLSNNLSTAGKEIFMECAALESATIPGSLKRVPEKMFYICSSLTEVVLEEGVERTGSYAFCECPALKTVSVPSTLKGVDVWSFGNCLELESFSVPDSITFIDSAAFYRCKKIPEIIMPDTVTSIGTHALRACSALTNLRLSENLVRIPYRSLNGCGFSEIKIPESVIYIDDEAFYQCQKLTSIEIPDGVVSIGKQAFYGCFKMTECIIYSEDVTFGANAFLYVADDCKIWVPEKSNTLTSAEELGITCCPIEEYASVANQEVFVNGNLVSAGTDASIKTGDTITVKYRIITADDADNDLFFAFLRFDSENRFLGFEQRDANILQSSQTMLEESFEVTDESEIKVILFSSIAELKALCPAQAFKSE